MKNEVLETNALAESLRTAGKGPTGTKRRRFEDADHTGYPSIFGPIERDLCPKHAIEIGINECCFGCDCGD